MQLLLSDIKYILTIKITFSVCVFVYSRKYLVPMNTADEISNNTLHCWCLCMTCCICPLLQIQRRFLCACLGWSTSGTRISPSRFSSACWVSPHRRSTQVRTATHDFSLCSSLLWTESVEKLLFFFLQIASDLLVGCVGASVPDRHWSRSFSVWSPLSDMAIFGPSQHSLPPLYWYVGECVCCCVVSTEMKPKPYQNSNIWLVIWWCCQLKPCCRRFCLEVLISALTPDVIILKLQSVMPWLVVRGSVYRSHVSLTHAKWTMKSKRRQ